MITSTQPSVKQVNTVVTILMDAQEDKPTVQRIARGADIVDAGEVELTYGGVYLVTSAIETDKAYVVIPVGDRWTCNCLDYANRSERCKHGWAVVIYRACERMDAEQNDPTPDPWVPTITVMPQDAAQRAAVDELCGEVVA